MRLTEDIGQTEFGKGFADHIGGSSLKLHGAIVIGRVFRRGAKQQFVTGQPLVLVKDRLAAYEHFAQLLRRLGC
ncbi:MAG: hypothetical protein Q8O52_30290 [Sulfuritalea sp.]|nr:hypothetical protein [Sulfuritalea sp.]